MRSRAALRRALVGVLALPSIAAAQPSPTVCDSCESCTAALATDHAVAELRGDIDASHALTCVRIAGRGATFDGHRHVIRGAAVGVAVAADDVVVRNVTAQEGGFGFRVTGASTVTLLNAAVSDARVGVRIEDSRNVRVVRALLARNRVGVSMGADDAGQCARAMPLASAGVVIVRSRVDGGGVGVAACDAMPVLIGNTVSNNDLGVVLGEVRAQGTGPRGGAWDECSCAPSPGGVTPGTLLLYSSGCGGCTVHEGWLAQERARGAVIRARSGGADGGVEQARFDAHARHCAPEMIDALGIPGCVPNYECPASGEVWKRREGDRELVTDRGAGSPDEVVAFSESCRAAGRQGYARGGRCVAAALRSNTLCGNHRSDLTVSGALARWGSVDDRCGVVSGAGSCSQSCAGVVVPAVSILAPSASTTEPDTVPAASMSRAVPADAGVGADGRVAPAGEAVPSRPGGWWLFVGAAAATLGVAAWRSRARRPRP